MLAPVTLREESALESAPDLDATKNREKEKMKLPSRTTGKMSERGVEIYSEHERYRERRRMSCGMPFGVLVAGKSA